MLEEDRQAYLMERMVEQERRRYLLEKTLERKRRAYISEKRDRHTNETRRRTDHVKKDFVVQNGTSLFDDLMSYMFCVQSIDENTREPTQTSRVEEQQDARQDSREMELESNDETAMKKLTETNEDDQWRDYVASPKRHQNKHPKTIVAAERTLRYQQRHPGALGGCISDQTMDDIAFPEKHFNCATNLDNGTSDLEAHPSESSMQERAPEQYSTNDISYQVPYQHQFEKHPSHATGFDLGITDLGAGPSESRVDQRTSQPKSTNNASCQGMSQRQFEETMNILAFPEKHLSCPSTNGCSQVLEQSAENHISSQSHSHYDRSMVQEGGDRIAGRSACGEAFDSTMDRLAFPEKHLSCNVITVQEGGETRGGKNSRVSTGSSSLDKTMDFLAFPEKQACLNPQPIPSRSRSPNKVAFKEDFDPYGQRTSSSGNIYIRRGKNLLQADHSPKSGDSLVVRDSLSRLGLLRSRNIGAGASSNNLSKEAQELLTPDGLRRDRSLLSESSSSVDSEALSEEGMELVLYSARQKVQKKKNVLGKFLGGRRQNQTSKEGRTTPKQKGSARKQKRRTIDI